MFKGDPGVHSFEKGFIFSICLSSIDQAVGWKTGSRGMGMENGEWGVNTNFSFYVLY